MRKLAWFAAGFTAACLIGAYLLSGWWLILLAAVSAVSGVFCLLKKSLPWRCAGLTLLGAAAAFVWFFGFDAVYLSHARQFDGQEMDAAVEVSDYSYATQYGIAADGKVMLDGKDYRIRIYLYDDVVLSPGDRVEGTIRLRYTASGGLDEMTYHQGKGIFLLGYFAKDAVVTPAAKVPVKYFPSQMRQSIKNILDTVFPEDTLAFARALLLGDSSLLSYRDSTDLSVSGIRHIIAVSGLHVSILFSLVVFFFGYHRIRTPIIGVPLLAVFAALAGFTPSVVRACLMQALMILALVADKEYDPPTALGFAVLVMLIINPLTATSVSFQLSVACLVGILGISEKIHRWLLSEKRFGPAKGKSLKARFTRWICGSVSVTLGAMVTTTPLCAWYFGMVSLVGIVTNLLCLWMVTALFCGIVAACIAGALWLPLGKLIAWVVSWLARYILFVARTLASIPMAAVYTESVYIVIWLVFCYVLLGVFVLAKVKRPVILSGLVAAGLCAALVFSWVEPRLDPYRMTVLDVGQGQCILLQTQGKNYLVDCGGDSADEAADLAAQTLLSYGVWRLDGVIVTHYDIDHAGGVAALLSRVPAKRLYLPALEDAGNIRSGLEEANSDRIDWIYPGQSLAVADGLITLFAGKEGSSDNESSLCVLFQPENCDIMITADRSAAGERELMSRTDLPDIEVLVVGHHGAKSSTGLELLHTARPEIAVISVGSGNRYGHPAPEVLARLERYGCRVLRTDIIGTIIIRG